MTATSFSIGYPPGGWIRNLFRGLSAVAPHHWSRDRKQHLAHVRWKDVLPRCRHDHEQPLEKLRRKGVLPRLTITDQAVDLVDCATSHFAGAASRVKHFIVLLLLIFLRNFLPHLWDTSLRN